MSDSVVLRGAVTALSWLLKQAGKQRAVKVSEIEDGLRWLGEAGTFHANEAKKTLRDLAETCQLPVLPAR